MKAEPVTAAEVFEPAQVAPVIQQYGFAVWRGLMPAATIGRLFQNAAAHINTANYVSTRGGVLKGSVCPPELQFDRASPEIDNIFRTFWGGDIEYCEENCCFMIQLHAHRGDIFLPHPWHQDEPFLPGPRIMSWTALTPCGVNSPSMSMAMQRRDHVIFDHSATAERVKGDETAAVMAKSGIPWVNLVLEPGDTVFFDGLTIHKTFFTPEMTKDRIAFKLAAGAAASSRAP